MKARSGAQCSGAQLTFSQKISGKGQHRPSPAIDQHISLPNSSCGKSFECEVGGCGFRGVVGVVLGVSWGESGVG